MGDGDYPERVLYRSAEPILSPDVTYERSGFKPGIVYPCGAVVREGNLYVYYGAADNYVCVAMSPLKDFLDHLKRAETPDFKSHFHMSRLGDTFNVDVPAV